MTDLEKELDLGQKIIEGTKEVFSSMLMMDVKGEDVSSQGRSVIDSNMTSMIGLGGDIRGMLAVHCPATVAKAITGGFLGMDVDELDDDVKDAIGEIANMLAGNLKIAYDEHDLKIELAIPSSIIGESFRLTGLSGAHKHYVAFELECGTFWVELMYVLS